MMQLVERFWAAVTTITSIITFSSLSDNFVEQNLLQAPLAVSSGYSTIGHVEHEAGPVLGPIFKPPGSPESSSFYCNYSSMVGWEPCSTPIDRKCWLRRTSDGKQYDIYTDYEQDMPTGINRSITINLEDGYYDADGLNFTSAKLFNGSYPGPWIEACWGDTINITVNNDLRLNGTSVHWHGIRQNQTMHMDGVNGVTQCPIAPKDYFVYNFSAVQYGSSWYHSHYSVQYADGALGPMTLHGPTSDNFDEAISPPLIMTDWGHNSAFDAVATKNLSNPDILLNGLGNITKYNNTKLNETKVLAPYTIIFQGPQKGQPNQKYLIRIINASFQTTFVFSIDNHILTVVEADFVPIIPYTTTSILVAIGQRYDIIVEAKPQQDPNNPIDLPKDNNYWIRTTIGNCNHDMNPGDAGYDETGILRYDSSSAANPNSSVWSDITPTCVDETSNLHPVVCWTIGDSSNDPPDGETFEVQFDSSWSKKYYQLAEFGLGAATTPFPLQVNYTNITFFNLDNKGSWQDLWRVQPEDYDATKWVYLVIEGGFSHPIHLHGHDFAVLEQAVGPYNASATHLVRTNPPRRDVVLLPDEEGYVVIAFKADNPGTWLVHCHIAFHISRGLGMQILEDQEAAAKIWPTGNSHALEEAHRVCDNWEEWSTNPFNVWNQDDSGV